MVRLKTGLNGRLQEVQTAIDDAQALLTSQARDAVELAEEASMGIPQEEYSYEYAIEKYTAANTLVDALNESTDKSLLEIRLGKVYTSLVKYDGIQPIITLIGEEYLDLSIDDYENYADSGATALDDLDGDITENIIVTITESQGDFGPTHTYHYNVSDSAENAAEEVTRTIYIIAVDTTPPEIILFSDSDNPEVLDNPLYSPVASPYLEPIANAFDERDGDLTEYIVITITDGEGNQLEYVDQSAEGTYVYHYNVSDSAGNAAAEVKWTLIIYNPENV